MDPEKGMYEIVENYQEMRGGGDGAKRSTAEEECRSIDPSNERVGLGRPGACPTRP